MGAEGLIGGRTPIECHGWLANRGHGWASQPWHFRPRPFPPFASITAGGAKSARKAGTRKPAAKGWAGAKHTAGGSDLILLDALGRHQGSREVARPEKERERGGRVLSESQPGDPVGRFGRGVAGHRGPADPAGQQLVRREHNQSTSHTQESGTKLSWISAAGLAMSVAMIPAPLLRAQSNDGKIGGKYTPTARRNGEAPGTGMCGLGC